MGTIKIDFPSLNLTTLIQSSFCVRLKYLHKGL